MYSTGSRSPALWKKFSFPIILQRSLGGIVSREVSESENMPSSCHGCFGISFSHWPPGALLASVFKGNVGTGRPYCLCHESLLASSALLFSALNGEIRSGGDWERKRPEKKSISFQAVEGCYQTRAPYVRMYRGESSLCFFSLAAPQAALQPMDPFLNVRFLFVLFKMWHSGSFLKGRRRQRSVGLPSARARADQAEQGRRGAQPGSRRCHLLNGLSGTVCQWLSVPSGACM